MKKYVLIILLLVSPLVLARSVLAVPATKLLLDSPQKSLKVGETIPLTVSIDPGPNTLAAVDLVLIWDKTVFEGVNFVPDSFLPNVISPATINSGEARVSLGVAPGSPKTGKGILGTLNLKAISSGETTAKIVFSKDTKAAGFGEKGNIIVSMGELLVRVDPGPAKQESAGITKKADDKLNRAGDITLPRPVLALIISLPLFLLGAVMLFIYRSHGKG